MANSKTTKKALLSSALALTLCVAMLIATTFAWFTDTASTSVNKIQAGTLDVTLEMATAWDTDGTVKTWEPAENQTLSFLQKDANGGLTQNADILWEPGCTYELPALRISNNGNLALKYKIIISGIKGNAKLNDVITWTIKNDADADKETNLATTEYELAGKTTTPATEVGVEATTNVDSDILTISGTMNKNAGNEYQGLSIDGIGITVIATQLASEFDSTTQDYDADAEYPVVVVKDVEVDNTVDADGNVTETKVAKATTIETDKKIDDTTPLAKATIPAGVKTTTADSTGTSTVPLTLSITDAAKPAEGTAVEKDQASKSFEIKMDGVSESNKEEIEVVFYTEQNLSNVKIYHNGVAMAADKYEYAPDTGKVTIKSATFSPFDLVFDAPGIRTVTTQEEIDAALADTSIRTIRLDKNWTGDMYVNGAKDVTLDFNGYTVSGTMYVGCTYDWFFYDDDTYASELTLKDSGTTGGVQTANETAVCIRNGSSLTIDSGTYETTGSGVSWGSVVKMSNGNLTVNGGYLHNAATNGDYNYVIRVKNYEFGLGKLGDASVTVNGGKFEGNNPESTHGNYSHLIASDSSGNEFDVEINGGEFFSYDGYSYLTEVYGKVLVTDCTFTYTGTGNNEVFDNVNKGCIVTVKGGSFEVNNKTYNKDTLPVLKNLSE